MIVMIDNYDSFTYNLVQYLQELQEQVLVYRNDEISVEQVLAQNPTMVVISPGPGTPMDAGISRDLVKACIGRIPVLGICLGHQTIGSVLGMNIVCGIEPVHGKVHRIHNNGTGVFRGLPADIRVTRYHSLVVDGQSLPPELMVTAWTDQGEIMGIRHKEYLVEGIQFHPEAILTEYGKEMLYHFLQAARKAGGA